MIKTVVDVNILVSGRISSRSSPAKIIDLWQKRKFVLVTSKEILKELQRVLNYPKITKKYHLSKEKIDEYIRGFFAFSEVCSPTERISVIEDDSKDNKFIEAAISTRADFIVSGDKHLLNLGKYQRVGILTAKEFLRELEKSKE